MKMVSKLALATMLSLGAMSMTAAPAFAQKSKKEEQAAAKAAAEKQKALLAQLSPEYRKAAAEVETAVNAKDWATVDAKLPAVEALAQNEVEKFFAANYRLQLEFSRKSDPGMAKALDVLIPNPNTAPASLAQFNLLRGGILFNEKKYDQAIPYFLKARELGNNDPDLSLQLAQSYLNLKKNAEGIAEMNKAMEASKAAGKKPPESWYKFTFTRVYNSGDRAQAAVWASRWYAEYPSVENWRYVITNYRNSLGNADVVKKDKLELYRLLRATNALADENDYLQYANSAANGGLPWEVVAVIDEGRKNGKISQGSSDASTLYSNAQTALKGEQPLEAQAKAASTGKQAMAAGDAFMASGNYARAVELYDTAAQKGSVDAEVLQLHRGYALFQLGRKPEAKAAFALVTRAPLSDIAKFWTQWIDGPAAA